MKLFSFSENAIALRVRIYFLPPLSFDCPIEWFPVDKWKGFSRRTSEKKEKNSFQHSSIFIVCFSSSERNHQNQSISQSFNLPEITFIFRLFAVVAENFIISVECAWSDNNGHIHSDTHLTSALIYIVVNPSKKVWNRPFYGHSKICS